MSCSVLMIDQIRLSGAPIPMLANVLPANTNVVTVAVDCPVSNKTWLSVWLKSIISGTC